MLVYLRDDIISMFKSVSTPPEAMEDFPMASQVWTKGFIIPKKKWVLCQIQELQLFKLMAKIKKLLYL